MPNAVIVDVLRTPAGARNGGLSGWHPVDLAAEVLAAIVSRNDLDPALIDEVVMGCVMQVGAQALNIGRNAVLAAGLPESVPATTVDRQCGSSEQALHFVAQGVMAGAYDIAIAAGVEVMSLVPIGASGMVPAVGTPFGPRVMQRYAGRGGLVPQGISAERVAEAWGLDREELDAFGVRSHTRAAQAAAEGRFEGEILAVAARTRDKEPGTRRLVGGILSADEGIRPDVTLAELGELKAEYQDGGTVTAGNSARLGDGASAVLVMSESRAERLGWRPRARIRGFGRAGIDPILALTGPIAATRDALARSGLGIDDLDRIEVNESFAAVVLAWARELHPDMERVNVNGGAIALGHPPGCSGTRLTTTLLSELERSGGRYGLQTTASAGGLANATVLERLG